MFDWYEPEPGIQCPVCSASVEGWQSSDGPCGLLVWRQGNRYPIDQRVDDDVRWNDGELEKFVLPGVFRVYGTCDAGHGLEMEGRAQGGIWLDVEAPVYLPPARASLVARSASPAADLESSSEDGFLRQAVTSFEDIVRSADLVLHDVVENEWWAAVTWRRDQILLRVSDDRRDRLVEVTVLRPSAGPVLTEYSVLARGGDLAIPLWAIVESAGGSTAFDLAGADRLGRLPDYVEAVQRFALPFVINVREPLDAVVEVILRRNWEWSEEGRKARRWLP